MSTQARARWNWALLSSFAVALSLVISQSGLAQTTNLGDEETSAVEEDLNPYTEPEIREPASLTDESQTTTVDPGMIGTDEPLTPAVAETRGERPTMTPSNVRVIPAVGAASFTTGTEATLENFDDGFAGGVYADFGSGSWAFETGVLVLSTEGSAGSLEQAFDVDSWGIPLLAKWSLSGRPQETIFLKAGVLPFQPDGAEDDLSILGTAGIGGAIPLFQQTALTLEGTYNRILEDGTNLGDYQGFTALVGLQLAL